MRRNEIYLSVYAEMEENYSKATGKPFPYDSDTFVYYLSIDRYNISCLNLLNDSGWKYLEKSYLCFFSRLPELELKESSCQINSIDKVSRNLLSLSKSREFQNKNKNVLFLPFFQEADRKLGTGTNVNHFFRILNKILYSRPLLKIWKSLPPNSKLRIFIKNKIVKHLVLNNIL